MIPNVSRGAAAGGLVDYLAEDGRLNVHADQRVIDGSLGQEGDLGDLDFRASIVRDLSAPGQAFPRVQARVRGADGKLQHAPIWHCSLSLKVGETPLSDAEWRPVVRDFMAGMGFPDDSRWVVVGHGLSRDGNPHVHVAASLVTESGGRVSTRLDWPRSQAQCTRLELKYGLRVVESRLTGTTSPGLSKYEAAALRRTGVPPERWQLRDRVRAIAGLVQTEAQFIDRLRASVQVRARADSSGKVTGYAVAMPGSKVWFGGGTLARDLSVGSLRRDWRGPQQPKGAWNGTSPVKPEPVRVGSVKQVGGELDRLATGLATGKVKVADAAHQVAGALAAAGRTGDAVECGKLAGVRPGVGAGKRVAVSAGLFLAGLVEQDASPGQAATARQLAALFMAIQAAHQMVVASNRKAVVMAGDGWGSRWFKPSGNTAVQQQDGGVQVREVTDRQRAAQARLDARAARRATMTQPWDAQTLRGFMVADDIAKNHPDAYQHHAPVPVEAVSEAQAARIAALGTQLMGSEFRTDYVSALGKGEATVLERQLENGLGAAQVAQVDAGLVAAPVDPVLAARVDVDVAARAQEQRDEGKIPAPVAAWVEPTANDLRQSARGDLSEGVERWAAKVAEADGGWLGAAQEARAASDPGLREGVQEWLAAAREAIDTVGVGPLETAAQGLGDGVAPTDAQLMAVEGIESARFSAKDLQPDFQVLDKDTGLVRAMTDAEEVAFTASVAGGEPVVAQWAAEQTAGQSHVDSLRATLSVADEVQAVQLRAGKIPDPENWATRLDPVTPAQRGKLLGQGFKPADIDGLTKGYASHVISGKLDVERARTWSEQARQGDKRATPPPNVQPEVRNPNLDRAAQQQAHRQRRSG